MAQHRQDVVDSVKIVLMGSTISECETVGRCDRDILIRYIAVFNEDDFNFRFTLVLSFLH